MLQSQPMFGMGMGEILLIAVVALLFLGPEKLPDAAKTISKGIRDFRKQTRELQQIVEDDHELGGAIRDIKSALRGEDLEAAERRRKAVAAARQAADNAAKAAEEMAKKQAAADLQAATAEGEQNSDMGGAEPADDDRDVATMLGMADESGEPLVSEPGLHAFGTDVSANRAEAPETDPKAEGDGEDDSAGKSSAADARDNIPYMYRPMAGAVAYTPKPLLSNDPDDDPDDDPDESGDDSEAEAPEVG